MMRKKKKKQKHVLTLKKKKNYKINTRKAVLEPLKILINKNWGYNNTQTIQRHITF